MTDPQVIEEGATALLLDATTVEIVPGVASGAEVVVAGNTRLSDGASIEIVKPSVAD